MPSRRSAIARLARRVAFGAVGGVVTTARVVMLVTPGPGIVVTLLGLGILGREFPSAQRQLRRLRGLWTSGPRGKTDSGS